MRLAITGVSHERRFDIVRNLSVGDKVNLVPTKGNKHDPEAIEVRRGRRQIGWVPREMATAIRGLVVRQATVATIGTDNVGRWTHLEIDLVYDSSSPAAKVISEVGPAVASVLHRMVVKNVQEARTIAALPKEVQDLAIEEWNTHHTTERRPRPRKEKP